jgi:hypothetical protein
MSRVYEFTTTHISNVIQLDAWERWSTWMRQAGRAGFDLHSPPQEYAQRVLGRQDFCWNGSVRHWIWVREFQADLGDGRVEPWRWRLFASKRGYALEVEDKGRPFGSTLRIVGPQALDHFIATWEAGT